MPRLIDLTNQTFGRLTVIERDYTKINKVHWLCKCDCGNPNTISVQGTNLRSGHTKSCGHCKEYEMINKKFGKLTVLEIDNNYKKQNNLTTKSIYFKVVCDCGNIITVLGASLRSGHTKSCGHCYEHDIIGKKFNRLFVLEEDKEKTKNNRQRNFKALCDCGNIISIRGDQLQSGKTQSCGCLQKEKATKDLSSQIFGYLKVLYPTDKRGSDGSIFWHCKCLRCGSECDVLSQYLQKGSTKSCGCLNTSYGEAKIQDILQINQILYEKEKNFEDCINPETNWKLRYDFYLPDYNRLIEFDGIQHFSYTNSGWNTKEYYDKAQQRDKIKNEYALNNNIDLIRIPYTEVNNINLELLLGTKFLIKKEEKDVVRNMESSS